MFRMATPAPPPDEGHWTLLQHRMDRTLWQWDRVSQKSNHGVTRFVIIHDPSRHDFDDCDEAVTMFQMMES